MDSTTEFKYLLCNIQKLYFQTVGMKYFDLEKLTTTESDCDRQLKILHAPCRKAVTLGESSDFVSQGTTGLNTWQAGIYMSNWLIENTSLIQGKSILELGCGVGLSGLTALHYCRPKSYTFTDCNPKVLAKIKENLQINGFSCSVDSGNEKERHSVFKERDDTGDSFENSHGSHHRLLCCTCTPSDHVAPKQSHVSVCLLDWDQCNFEEIEKFEQDIVLASDVIFHPHTVKPLVNVLKCLLTLRNDTKISPVAYVASTIRNENTYNGFLCNLENAGIKYKRWNNAFQHDYLFYEKSSEIEFLQLEM
ncbi:protein-lysine N-methyltransferase EEF2KMT-like isoform X2 [Xenia sp. Carnegie-2017]|uniref:protein-lysine N-methyltransferase EEF2KMT-like isoform X2 n=1 Tax=Xenia sp. Carnegie-2017 TaxID=2897299 RepID=UPI001F044406|nr:protein-lysine N-methyltransferase EEF2KMT-like isoform X2 [Xenia sp. Carnegie-2017]